MQLTRRHFITTWGASATVVLLAACTAQPAASPTSPAAPAAKPAQSAPAPAATQSAPAAPQATTPPPATPAAAPTLVQGQVLRAPEPNPKRGGILRYIAGIGTAHYDLHQGASPNLLAHAYEGLVTWNILDGLNSIAPSLAQRWEVSPDGKVYTFYLRDGVKFHDGTPFSADDVVATFQRILFPPTGMISVYKDLFGSVSSVEKVDSLTVKFTLNSPWFTFLQAMATAGIGSIYSKKALDDNGQDLRKIAAPGTGPFIFKEYKTGESMSLVRNPNYWNPELPYLDGLTGLNVGPADDRGTAVLTDRGDFAHHTGNTTFKEADNHKDIVSTGVALQCTLVGLYMNIAKKPFADQRVRRAVFLARNAMDMFNLYRNYERPEFGRWVPFGDTFAMVPEDIQRLPGWRSDKTQDVADAKSLMSDAGYANGIQGVDMVAWGTHVSYNVAVAFQDWMRRILNIDAKLRPIEQAQLTQEIQNGTYDCALYFYGTSGSILDFSPLAHSLFKTGGGQNITGYSNPEFDALLSHIDTEQDRAKRTTLIRQAEDMLDANPPVVPVGWAQAQPMWRTTVKGAVLEKRRINVGCYGMETAWLDK